MPVKLTEAMREALRYVAANEGRAGLACRLSRISEPTRQSLIDLAMNFEPPLVDADGDFVHITPAGRAALEKHDAS
jgi:hypothetical protein